MMKDQSKPQVYKSDIAPCGHIKPAVDTDYKITMLSFSKVKKET